MKKDHCSISNPQTCTPCTEGTHRLSDVEIKISLSNLGNHWELNKLGHLDKEFKFLNYYGVVDFFNRVSDLANQQGHHPDMHTSYNKCGVEIWTHKINGLSENDFILAGMIDELY